MYIFLYQYLTCWFDTRSNLSLSSQLSSQLEALAGSIEMKPPAEQDDEIIKPNMNGSKTPNGNKLVLPITTEKPIKNGNFEIEYQERDSTNLTTDLTATQL
jgi:hypothetical protein